MKVKIRLVSIVLSSLLLLSACDSQQSQSNQTSLNNNANFETTVLYEKAITILDELDDARVDDFNKAYDLLMNMPDNKDDFINQLDKVNSIFEKYDVDFKYGGWYLQPYLSDESITKEGISEYKAKKAYWDAENLLEAIVYPALFDKYGNDAQHIEGLLAANVISSIESTCDYALDDKSESYNGYTETWKYIGIPKCDYEIRYHDNGLVESVNIPIIRSDAPLDDAAFTDFFAYDLTKQKQFAENRFSSMIEQLNSIFTGYEVLSQIYTDEEIGIICNYIKSLTTDEIWQRNLWTYNAVDSEPLNYAGAVVSFEYRGNSVSIHYGLNSIYLRVIGGDYINPLSCRWYTLYCGLVLPDGNDETIATYQNYIDFNIAANDITADWSFDLDANAQKYAENSSENSTDTKEFVLSSTDKITVEGIIEQNSDAFPQYRLKLSTPIHIVLKEYDEEFDCQHLYFYEEAELNGNYNFSSLNGKKCCVTAMLENYRGGGNLFLLNPVVTTDEQNANTQVSDATIKILSVRPCEDGMYNLTVDYKIENIQNVRGCVYLKCDAHAFTTQMFFNDENHRNDYCEDGMFSYDVGWQNDGITKSLNIRYGYGEFDPYTGWTKECSVKIYYRLIEDYGKIASTTIPQDEIFDIYDGEKYIGAWTLNPTGDLIEIDGNSTKQPFSINNTFTSSKGVIISVASYDGYYSFSINGNQIGIASDAIEMNDALLFEIDADNGTYLITRYPNDEYISVGTLGFLDSSLDGEYYP